MFTYLFRKASISNRRPVAAATWLTLIGLIMSPTGCSNLKKYDVTFNDRAVYSPQVLFSDYRINDKALSMCIEQAIKDFEVYSASGLEILNCSDAGIQSLLGLSQFKNLKRLKLSDNNIRNLVELSVMGDLIDVQLDGNQVVDGVPLTVLSRLEQVNLSRNPALQCDGLGKFSSDVDIILPEHCQ
ncbi:MAG: hypothetical protein VW779_01335 [Halieaceae bacterium]